MFDGLEFLFRSKPQVRFAALITRNRAAIPGCSQLAFSNDPNKIYLKGQKWITPNCSN